MSSLFPLTVSSITQAFPYITTTPKTSSLHPFTSSPPFHPPLHFSPPHPLVLFSPFLTTTSPPPLLFSPPPHVVTSGSPRRRLSSSRSPHSLRKRSSSSTLVRVRSTLPCPHLCVGEGGWGHGGALVWAVDTHRHSGGGEGDVFAQRWCKSMNENPIRWYERRYKRKLKKSYLKR